jgi:hypothetical protein
MKTGICGQTRKVSQKGKIPFGVSFPLCISAKTNRHNGWFLMLSEQNFAGCASIHTRTQPPPRHRAMACVKIVRIQGFTEPAQSL